MPLEQVLRVLNKFFGLREFPYLKLEIRDFKAKSGRDSGLKEWREVGSKNNPRDYGIARSFGAGLRD